MAYKKLKAFEGQVLRGQLSCLLAALNLLSLDLHHSASGHFVEKMEVA